MSPLDLDIEVPRNGHYCEMWQLLDDVGNPIDLQSSVLSMAARPAAGSGSVIASAQLTLEDPEAGKFIVTWAGSDFNSVEGSTEVVRVAYDFKKTDSDAVARIIARGHLVLFPGVTP